jgi:hypothetical protein
MRRIIFEEIQTTESMIQFAAKREFPVYSVSITLIVSLCLIFWLRLIVTLHSSSLQPLS